ncbi:hypothetical protein [Synechococcus sp. CBW1107]|uniref:hypothetical protein n=1 Tax=Synechococcus sp. CBW1107 TaxID=2789857 RepID=UPI002AD52ECE|nr:hypothetical protein [Synechococcus sp. CBW1107]
MEDYCNDIGGQGLDTVACDDLGFPRFQGQVAKGHAMTIRLSIDDQSIRNQMSVYGVTEG